MRSAPAWALHHNESIPPRITSRLGDESLIEDLVPVADTLGRTMSPRSVTVKQLLGFARNAGVINGRERSEARLLSLCTRALLRAGFRVKTSGRQTFYHHPSGFDHVQR
jgi:hypothetical protein